MNSRVWRAGLLSLTGIFQRLLSALTGNCCLFPVFFFFSVVQGLVLLRAKGFLNRTVDDNLCHPALGYKKLFSLSYLQSLLFSV
jgi:hypothetical protein